MSTDDPITDNEAWLVLPEGAKTTVLARLDSIHHGGQGCIMLAFADWTSIVIRCDQTAGIPGSMIRKYVRVRCRRTEDGLEGISIRLALEMSVPVPLMSGNLT